MRLFARHRAEIPSRAPSHRLLWASLLLALLLLLTFGAALFLFISLHNTKKIRCAALRSGTSTQSLASIPSSGYSNVSPSSILTEPALHCRSHPMKRQSRRTKRMSFP